jgi:hypothetical protein
MVLNNLIDQPLGFSSIVKGGSNAVHLALELTKFDGLGARVNVLHSGIHTFEISWMSYSPFNLPRYLDLKLYVPFLNNVAKSYFKTTHNNKGIYHSRSHLLK